MRTFFSRNPKLVAPAAGVLQALGVVAYIFLLSTVVFGRLTSVPFDHDPMLGPVTMLSLFCFSALLCGTVTLAYPLILLFQKRYRDAVTVILSMIITMGIILGLWLAYVVSVVGPLGYHHRF